MDMPSPLQLPPDVLQAMLSTGDHDALVALGESLRAELRQRKEREAREAQSKQENTISASAAQASSSSSSSSSKTVSSLSTSSPVDASPLPAAAGPSGDKEVMVSGDEIVAWLREQAHAKDEHSALDLAEKLRQMGVYGRPDFKGGERGEPEPGTGTGEGVGMGVHVRNESDDVFRLLNGPLKDIGPGLSLSQSTHSEEGGVEARARTSTVKELLSLTKLFAASSTSPRRHSGAVQPTPRASGASRAMTHLAFLPPSLPLVFYSFLFVARLPLVLFLILPALFPFVFLSCHFALPSFMCL